MTEALCCPHCAARLRVRDRMFIGRQVGCPDCGGPIRIVADGPRGFSVEQVSPPAPQATAQRAWAAIVPAELGRRFAWLSPLASPTGVAWSLAGGFAVVLLLMVVSPFDRAATSDATGGPPDSRGTETAGVPEGVPPVSPERDVPPPPRPVKPELPVPPAASPPVTATLEADQPILPPVVEKPASPEPPPAVVSEEPRERDEVARGGEPQGEAGRANGLKAEIASVTPPPIDVAAQLRQPIHTFQQSRAVPLRDLLVQIEEMIGAPVRIDEEAVGAARLDRPLSFSVQNTTVGGILEALLDRAGLTWEIERDGIRVQPPAPEGD